MATETKKKTTKKKAEAPKSTEATLHGDVPAKAQEGDTTLTEATILNEKLLVKVKVPLLNVRKSHGYDAEVVTVIKADTVCEIIETIDGWGKLSDDKGWICLEFADKIEE